jgi:acyl-homoserine-lactone acylase
MRYLLPLALLAAIAAPAQTYSAKIRRTSYGVPHIEAKDFGSLGYGEAWAQAEDHLCSIADQIVKAKGERAKYFGPGKNEEHLRSDIGMKSLEIYETAKKNLASMPKEAQEWFTGYVAGYNDYLAKTGKDNVGGWCKGADWVYPITAADLAAYHRSYTVTVTGFAAMIATAAPPNAPQPSSAGIVWPLPEEKASNGWGLGKDLTSTGRGMLLANPHYPWTGANRFWEKHLVVPGKLNVYGVGLLGTPGIAIGFNDRIAWTHTVSAGKRQVLYALSMVPGKPTTYKYDNTERPLIEKKVKVEVKQPDGSIKTVERSTWFSHYGPVLNMPGLGWTNDRAITVRDANWDNPGRMMQWLDMGRSKSLDDLKKAHAVHQQMPWVNTIATSYDGRAWYTDSASTPALSEWAVGEWMKRRESDPLVKRMAQQGGTVLLDGSDSRFEWQVQQGARAPGLVAFANMPQIERSDYVFNANDSFWLANSKAPLDGPYSPMHGDQRSPRSLRTRNNDLTLSGRSPDKPAGADGKFTLDELGNAILSNRVLAGELLRDDLVARCKQTPSIKVGEQTVDLNDACRALANWDLRNDLESRGAVLFREWITQFEPGETVRKGKLFAVDFDPKDPVNTPRQLSDSPAVLENLAKAALVMKSRNLAMDAPLGEVQYVDKAGTRIPLHGGDGAYDGVMNMQRGGRNTTTLEPADYPEPVKGSRFLTVKGYPVFHGSSFLMVLEFTDQGPHAKAFLTYGESGDPASPHFTDQSWMYSKKQWRPVLYRDSDIAKDVKKEYTVSSKSAAKKAAQAPAKRRVAASLR